VHVEPDAAQAAGERATLARTTRTVLARAALTVTHQEAGHPAVVEIAHAAQRVLRTTPEPERLAALGRLLDRARAGIGAPDPSRPVAPAEPGPHLDRSVARALKVVPARDGAPAADSTVVAWRARDARTFDHTLDLLAATWPQAHAELCEIVVQVALLHGAAIEGFTDFGIHGAILLNRTRLDPSADGLPGPIRLAEALVHEGAHTRCNAVAVTGEPVLRPADGADPLVATPLRADPRPLGGLFQQAVVLGRSVLLYERLLDHDRSTPDAVRARRDRLARDAATAVRTLGEHRGALSDHGAAVVDEVAEVAREYA
jgi:HEXXH motif-containing protein